MSQLSIYLHLLSAFFMANRSRTSSTVLFLTFMEKPEYVYQIMRIIGLQYFSNYLGFFGDFFR
jgi:hypothetical protein